MRKIAMLGAVLSMGMCGVAFAAEGPSYTYVEAGYGITDLQVPGANAGADGFVVAGSLELPNNFFVTASYGDRGYDEDAGGIDQTDLSAGVGYKWAVSDSVDFFAGASFESLKLKPDVGSSVDDTGFGVNVGVRSLVTEKLELNTTLEYTSVKLSDAGVKISGFGLSAGGRYYFTPSFAGGLDFVSDKFYAGISQATFIASLRYSFGGLF